MRSFTSLPAESKDLMMSKRNFWRVRRVSLRARCPVSTAARLSCEKNCSATSGASSLNTESLKKGPRKEIDSNSRALAVGGSQDPIETTMAAISLYDNRYKRVLSAGIKVAVQRLY
eukprot:Pompholyxophrys_sp_v1_NODE_232_length_1023_cov_54.922521.p2 type:complete len:116 gc:universal NODE_232_length_1023_cov_54.922521:165-512(+)